MAVKKKNFEESLKRLEEIVSLMERGDADLEQSVKLYQEGVEAAAFCAGKLKDIEQQVTLLKETAAGVFEEKPFAPGESAID